MKSLHILGLLLMGSCACLRASAQTGVSIDMTYGTASGQSKAGVSGSRFADIEGDPFLYDVWLSGTAKLTDGKTYSGLLLKYDIVNNMLIFKYSQKDTALTFEDKPVEFVLQLPDGDGGFMNFRNGFAPADGGNDQTFYRVLTDGNVKLLKRVKKTIQVSNSDMNNNVKNRTIVESTGYYILRGDKPIVIKNNKKSILNLLSDQAADLQKFIADNHLDMEKDEDLKQVIDHYNQIKKS